MQLQMGASIWNHVFKAEDYCHQYFPDDGSCHSQNSHIVQQPSTEEGRYWHLPSAINARRDQEALRLFELQKHEYLNLIWLISTTAPDERHIKSGDIAMIEYLPLISPQQQTLKACIRHITR